MSDFGHETFQALANLRVADTQHHRDLQIVVALVTFEVNREGVKRHEGGGLGQVDDERLRCGRCGDGAFDRRGLVMALVFFEQQQRADASDDDQHHDQHDDDDHHQLAFFLRCSAVFACFGLGWRFGHATLLIPGLDYPGWPHPPSTEQWARVALIQ